MISHKILHVINVWMGNFLLRSVARLSQKFPKAEFAEISKLVTDLAKIHKECCHGDLLECADDRVKYTLW